MDGFVTDKLFKKLSSVVNAIIPLLGDILVKEDLQGKDFYQLFCIEVNLSQIANSLNKNVRSIYLKYNIKS